MQVAILHQAASDESAVDEQDVLRQRDAVGAALRRLGHSVSVLPCTLDLKSVRDELQRQRPAMVFNLVESLGGSDRLLSLVPLLLEAVGIPYTGASAAAIQLTSSKTVAKRRLVEAELPTLPWVDGEHCETASHRRAASIPFGKPLADGSRLHEYQLRWPCRWIRKPIYEHASLGMTDDAVIECQSLDEVREKTLAWQRKLRRPCLAEPFVEGRELNVSLLAGRSNEPVVLPIAEIDFLDFPADKPKIVGFAAKWDEAAPEYGNTARRFPSAKDPLVERVARLARDCWREFDLSGYCRVDFRVDEAGQPWILEINANPCLSSDAGFAAALDQAGIQYDEAIARIVADALDHHGG
jgi:D-alanine-D-alanine ligase